MHSRNEHKIKHYGRRKYTYATALFVIFFWIFEGVSFAQGKGVLTDTVNRVETGYESAVATAKELIGRKGLAGDTDTAETDMLSSADGSDGSETGGEGPGDGMPEASDGDETMTDVVNGGGDGDLQEDEGPVIIDEDTIREDEGPDCALIRVNDTYFDDALFIGDSRMVGIYDYCGWNNATFLCDNGYSIRSYAKGNAVLCQNKHAKFTPEEIMESDDFGKVYIMIGTNDLPSNDTEAFREGYAKLIDAINEKEPDAVIYAVANLRMSLKGENSNTGRGFTNARMIAVNEVIESFADNEKIFYLDFNPLFCDEDGYVNGSYTFDGFHVHASEYSQMGDFFREHAVAYSVTDEQIYTPTEEQADEMTETQTDEQFATPTEELTDTMTDEQTDTQSNEQTDTPTDT